MDKQQADHIDHKIRQAAAHAEPPFKKEAWERMEVKLDEDLNRKRRRGFIWWWMFAGLILAGGLGVYMYQQEPGEKKAIPVASERLAKAPETTAVQPHLKSGPGGKVSLKHPGVPEPDQDTRLGTQLTIDKKNNRQQKQTYL